MRKIISYGSMLMLISIVGLVSCKKDDPVSVAFSLSAISGSWIINPSEGTEWEEGVGIITPRAPEPDLLNATLTITGAEVEVKDSGGTSFGSFPISVNESDMEVTITGIGTFEVKNYIGNVSMTWNQKEPKDHSDYEEKNPGQFLAFQKFWGLTRKP